MYDNLVNGQAPKMTEEEKRSVDRVYHSFLENMYSKKSKAKVEDLTDNYTPELVAKRAEKMRESLDKLVFRMDLLDRRFERKMKNLKKEDKPKSKSPSRMPSPKNIL